MRLTAVLGPGTRARVQISFVLKVESNSPEAVSDDFVKLSKAANKLIHGLTCAQPNADVFAPNRTGCVATLNRLS